MCPDWTTYQPGAKPQEIKVTVKIRAESPAHIADKNAFNGTSKHQVPDIL